MVFAGYVSLVSNFFGISSSNFNNGGVYFSWVTWHLPTTYNKRRYSYETNFLYSLAGLSLCVQVFAGGSDGQVCEYFGPQTPRDIDSVSGDNNMVFTIAPPALSMKLCNIHFHENVEHKAKDFSIFAGYGHDG